MGPWASTSMMQGDWLPSEAALRAELAEFGRLALESDYADAFAEVRVERRLDYRGGRVLHHTTTTDSGVGVVWLENGEYRTGHCGGAHPVAVRSAVALARGEAVPAAARPGGHGELPPGVGEWLDRAAATFEACERESLRASCFVTHVFATVQEVLQRVWIARPDTGVVADLRHYTLAMVTVAAEREGVSYQLSHTEAVPGPLEGLGQLPATAAELAGGASRMCGAAGSPDGSVSVVVAGSAAGTLVHEICGHSLEGDFLSQGASLFSQKHGQQVGAALLTVDDDPCDPRGIGGGRFDDEGEAARTTRLIDHGILEGALWDQLGARLRGIRSSGNGRRQSWQHAPLIRVTNTVVHPGSGTTADLVADMRTGLLVLGGRGGLADPVTGRFQIRATEVYAVEGGRVTHPVGGLLLTGTGGKLLMAVRAVSGDQTVTSEICGKGLQVVPVSVISPALWIDGIEVSGRC